MRPSLIERTEAEKRGKAYRDGGDSPEDGLIERSLSDLEHKVEHAQGLESVDGKDGLEKPIGVPLETQRPMQRDVQLGKRFGRKMSGRLCGGDIVEEEVADKEEGQLWRHRVDDTCAL